MKKLHTAVAGLFAALALSIAAVATAQPGMGYGPGMGHGPMSAADQAAMFDTHMAQLKTKLNITTSQEAAWTAFTTAAKQEAQTMHAAPPQSATTLSAPEQMAQHAAAMQQRATAMANMSTALNQLYAALTPEQKTLIDQHMSAMHQHHGMHAGHGG